MGSSGSRVGWKIFFVIFTKLIPRKNFFCIAKILVLPLIVLPLQTPAKRTNGSIFTPPLGKKASVTQVKEGEIRWPRAVAYFQENIVQNSVT